MSECVNETNVNENIPTEGMGVENATSVNSVQVPCVFYRKEAIDTVIGIINSIELKGIDNITAMSNIINILNNGTQVPVTVQE